MRRAILAVAGLKFATHYIRQRCELFDLLVRAGNCRTISPLFSLTKSAIKTTVKQRIRCLHSDQLQSDAKHNVSVFTNIRPTTFKETLTVIRSMSSKSLPLDKIPTRALKSCPEMFAELITHSGNFFARSLIRLISATAVYLKVKYQQ